MFKNIRYDLNAYQSRDPAARSKFEIFLLYSGFHAVFWYRLSHWFFLHNCFFLARLVSQLTKFFTGIEIHPGATIGKGLVIDHGSGVVIGETAVVGDDCTLYQGVTLGGTGKDTGKRHPTLGNNVLVGSGAKVLGPFTVGDNSKIASNAVVLKEIPPDSTAVGVPARVVRQGGKRIAGDLDQVHVPDPVSQEMSRMASEISNLQAEVAQLKQLLEQSVQDRQNQ
ncbi:MAG: serine O-acetyltransferase EpsC [Massiliimalia sp.]|jgi:serine O-acetyltransferase